MGKTEEEPGVQDNEISAAIRKAGMLYFEYDIVSHIAVRQDNIIEDGMPNSIENYPECVIEKTVPDLEQAEIFRGAFRNMDNGSPYESFEVEICMNSQVYWFEYNLIYFGKKNKVICIASNCTERHMQCAREKLLLKNQFEAVCLIDLLNETYRVSFMKHEDDYDYDGKTKSGYEAGCKNSAEKYVAVNDHEMFMYKSSLKVIKENLALEKKYSFIVNGFDSNGNDQLHQYSYQYLDNGKRMILATLEDVTKITDHDVLTGEFNRNGFNRYVTDFLDNCQERMQYAILFFNIKSFKAINDLLGLEGGDSVLKEFVNNLRESFLKPIAISRLEADHFALLIEQKNLDYSKLTELCHKTYEKNGKVVHYYGRCGVYPINTVKHDVSGMCDRARIANQYVEDDYVKPYAIYNKQMRKSFMKSKELLNELEHGVNNDEFEVYYQPIYDAVAEKIVSAEALVRWIHPEYGVISPAEFISAFEETGHISKLDLFVEITAKNFILNRLHSNKKIVPIAINLSRMDFYDTFFMNKILGDIKEIKQLDIFCRLEITESAYSALVEHATNYIKSFKESGVKILLDDFGSGYSSFSTIRQFDFDILKLDLEFIKMIGKSEKVEGIIKSIIDMAHILKLEVVAEGVETLAQKEFLIKHHCDFIQGYYYSKPLPREEFIKLLDNEI